MIWAHSENADGKRQPLSEHLEKVSQLCRTFAAKFGASELGYWSGLLHDVGKFHPDFQAYLLEKGRRPPVSHKAAGAILAAQLLEPLAFPIAGHHGGLANRTDLKNRLEEWKRASATIEAVDRAQALLGKIKLAGALAPPSYLKSPLEAEFFVRMIFSALVDADFLDTEQHFDPARASLRPRSFSWQELWEAFEQNHERLQDLGDSPVNRVRNEVYDAALKAANQNPGFFRLTVPTGGGKTRTSMAFALRHAIWHDLDRVIVAIPYTSIIEQTAEVYRDIFGTEPVLEHHSAIAPQEKDEYDLREIRQRLVAENWDARIIVTTTVQLFESLFSNLPSRCRKLHNISRSVIILDEAQTLPPPLLDPILEVLRQLVSHYHVSVVFCTATQPALDQNQYLRDVKPREIVPDPPRLFKALKRVEYESLKKGEPCSWAEVAEAMHSSEQCLAVVNTRKNALALLDALQDPEALHLSTLLCGAHRRQVLEEVRRRLQAGLPCQLVSTQVVEAGVDLDFPLVLRAMGPLDRIVQAAGRCNREGKLAMGRVIVFNPIEGGSPRGAYRTGFDTAEMMLKQNPDLHNPAVYEEYFLRFYQGVGQNLQIQAARAACNYPEVAHLFRMIDDQTEPVAVRYQRSDEAASPVVRLLEKLQEGKELSRGILRQLQPYLIGLYSNEIQEAKKKGVIEELIPGLWKWTGVYDRTRGIALMTRDPADLVI